MIHKNKKIHHPNQKLSINLDLMHISRWENNQAIVLKVARFVVGTVTVHQRRNDSIHNVS